MHRLGFKLISFRSEMMSVIYTSLLSPGTHECYMYIRKLQENKHVLKLFGKVLTHVRIWIRKKVWDARETSWANKKELFPGTFPLRSFFFRIIKIYIHFFYLKSWDMTFDNLKSFRGIFYVIIISHFNATKAQITDCSITD